jgi:hypothetical protein
MKKGSSKKENAQQRQERLLKEKLRSLFDRLSRLQKTVADFRARTLKDKSKGAG